MNVIGRASGTSCTFRVSLKSGVWSVSKDGTFYGDYLSRAQAIASACLGARTVEARGGASRVVAGKTEQVVPHHL